MLCSNVSSMYGGAEAGGVSAAVAKTSLMPHQYLVRAESVSVGASGRRVCDPTSQPWSALGTPVQVGAYVLRSPARALTSGALDP
jgi:hypothetical protein